MKPLLRALALVPIMMPIASFTHAQAATEIGGEKLVTLTRKATTTTHPEFTSVTVIPGRGMELAGAVPMVFMAQEEGERLRP